LIATVGTGGDAKRVVVGAGKGGQVLGMDPATGKLLWKTAVGVHENHDLTSLTGPTEVMPGTYGGVLTPPATAEGVVYVATLNAPATLEPDKTAYFATVVNDLVITGTYQGQVVVLDRATGKIVTTIDAGNGIAGWPAAVGDLLLVPTGTVARPGTLIAYRVTP
jgi:outer membrane protein assembly factor BamB